MMLLYELPSVFIAMQLQQLLSLPAGSLPDKVKLAVYDGEVGIGMFFGDGEEVPYSDQPDWFPTPRASDDVREFVGAAIALKKQRHVRYPDLLCDERVKPPAVTFVDESAGHTRVVARTVRDKQHFAGMHFPIDVLNPLAPLADDPEDRVTLALTRDEDKVLEVKVVR